jgi:hypothetical protein
MFFETPHATKSQSLIGLEVHVVMNNLESYLLIFNLYIMSVTNINIEFKHLAREHDTLLESNQKNFSEKQDLKAQSTSLGQ